MTESEQVLLERQSGRAILTLNRPERRNSLDEATLSELHATLDEVEEDSALRLVVLQGRDGVFCSGMDFQSFASSDGSAASAGEESPYMALLKRFSSLDKVIIAKVEGTVMAGGMGLVAASDLVFASPEASFSLSEALWGLLPAMVMPFLIRRVGYQNAYRLTLTTATIDATEARRINLVDELDDNPQARIQAASHRLMRLHPQTIADMKAYFRKMWIVNDSMEQEAVNELSRLTGESRIKKNIKDYVDLGRLPWEKW